MPSSLRLRIDGWFSRCRDKVQVRARAGREVTSAAPAMLKRDVPESQECHEPRASRHVSESDLQLARCFSTVQLAPPHGRLVESDGSYGAEPRPCPGLLGGDQKFCDVSLLLGRIHFIALYTCIITQGIEI